MKLTNKQVHMAFPIILKISNTELPVLQAYNIRKTLLNIKKQAEFIEQQRIELVKKYGKEKDGEVFEINKGDLKAKENFFKDFDAILNTVEEVDVRKLSIDKLDGVILSVEDLDKIDFMIDLE